MVKYFSHRLKKDLLIFFKMYCWGLLVEENSVSVEMVHKIFSVVTGSSGVYCS